MRGRTPRCTSTDTLLSYATLVGSFVGRVAQKPEAVAAAASTRGRRTMDAGRLADLRSGKFVGALRSVAAEMTLDEMHEKRGGYVSAVEARAADALARN